MVENLVLACRSCNSARRNLSLAQWAVYARETRGLVIDVAAILFAARRAA